MKRLMTAAILAAGLAPLMPAKMAQAQEPMLGQMTWFAGTFAPRGWAFCDGQLLPINSNQALYSLLGTTYGGDGRTTFALPDVRGRTPFSSGQSSAGSNYPLGSKGGLETVALTAAETPSHNHIAQLKGTSTAADGTTLDGAAFAESAEDMYLEGSGALNATLSPGSAVSGMTGGGQPHENRQPYLALHCIIALQGLFPSRN